MVTSNWRVEPRLFLRTYPSVDPLMKIMFVCPNYINHNKDQFQFPVAPLCDYLLSDVTTGVFKQFPLLR